MNYYNYICSKVADFNYLFGVIDYKYPNVDFANMNKFNNTSTEFNSSQVKLRFSLINEEIKELQQAILDKNCVEIIDALCDILYVVAGAKAYFNLPIDDFLEKQIKELYVNIETNGNLKEQITNIESFLNDDTCIKELNKIYDSNEELNNLTDAFLNKLNIIYHPIFIKHLVVMYDNCLDKIVKSIFTISNKFNIDIIKLFDIVHSSNMTKICETEIDAIETVEWYKENEKRYSEPSYRKINYNDNDYYVIYDKDSKKILKSIKYISVKFF